jgi:acetyl/propionyl-CoA carboxylase alpha subunit
MFQKILIANRGDSRRAAAAAAKTHVGTAGVMSKPECLVREARGDRAAGD